MATIDELNFKLILDDNEFNKKIDAEIKQAEKLNVKLSDLLTIKAKLRNMSTISKDTEMAMKRASNIVAQQAVNEQKVARAKLQTEAAERRLTSATRDGNREMSKRVNWLAQMKNSILGATSIYAAQRVLKEMINISGEFETQRVALRAILQDVAGADKIFGQIKTLAVASPYQFKELISYAKQLSAFSFPMEELYDTTKRLADVASGLGVDMSRIILAVGQVRSASVLRGQELRQFTEAGIPLIDELKRKFKEMNGEVLTSADIFDKISARLVPYSMIADIFKDMTSEGGKFYNMQEIQAETLKGKVSNLKDAYQIMFSEIGEKGDSILKGSVDAIRSLIENYEKVGRLIIEMVAAYGVYKTALVVVTMLSKGYTVAMTAQYGAMLLIEKVQKGINKLGLTNPYVLMAAGVTALGFAIYKLVTYTTEYEKVLKKLNDRQAEFEAKAMSDASGAEYLIKKLKGLTVGTKEYEQARGQLVAKYGDLLSEQDKEALKVGNLIGLYERLKASIQEASVQKFVNEGSDDIIDYQNKQSEDLLKEFNKLTKGLDEGLKMEFRDFIKGEIDVLSEKAQKVYNLRKYNKTIGETTDPQTGLVLGQGIQYNLFDELRKSNKLIESEVNRLYDELDNKALFRFGDKGALRAKAIIKEYEQPLEDLNKQLSKVEITQEQFNEKVKNLNVEKLTRLRDLYASLGIGKKADSYQKDIERLTKPLEAFEEKAKGIFVTKDTKQYMPLADDNWEAYFGKLKEAYKELGTTLDTYTDKNGKAVLGQEKTIEAIKNQRKALDEYAGVMNVSLVEEKKAGGGKSDAHIALEAQAAAIKKVHDAYEMLSPYLKGTDMTDALSKLFPSVSGDVITGIEKYRDLITAIANDLAKYDNEAADRLLLSVGGDESARLRDRLKAMQEYKDFIASWMGEDFNIIGEGITFDVSKIASDLNTAYDKVYQRREDALKKLHEAEKNYTGTQYALELNKINRLYEAERDYEKKLAQEKLNNLADKYVKEVTRGLDMTDWGDKTLGQIRKIKEVLKELREKGLGISEVTKAVLSEKGYVLSDLQDVDLSTLSSELSEVELKILLVIQAAQSAGLSAEELQARIDEALKRMENNATEEMIKNLRNTVQAATDVFGSIGSTLKDMGASIKNEGVENIGKMMEFTEKMVDKLIDSDVLFKNIGKAAEEAGEGASEAGEAISEVGEGAKSGGWIGIAIAGAKMVIEETIKTISEYVQYAHEAELATLRFAESLRQLSIKRLMEGGTDPFRNMFGENGLGDANNNISAYEKSLDDFYKTTSDFSDKMDALYDKDKGWWVGIGNILGIDPFGGGALIPWQVSGGTIEVFDRASESYKTYVAGIEKGYTKLQSMAIKTKDVSWFGEIFGFKDKYTNLGDLAPELFNDDGSLKMDSESLQSWYDEWKDKLSDSQQLLFERIIADAQMAEQAMEGVADYLESVFGEVADTIADKMIDAFVRTGDAAVELGDLMSDVARQMAKDLIKSLLYQQFLTPALEAVKKLWMPKNEDGTTNGDYISDEKERTKKTLEIIDDAFIQIESNTGGINDVLDYINNKYGLEGSNQKENMISGMTEETANLLASYINAIRADVSIAKSQRAQMIESLGGLSGFFGVGTKTYNEYMNEVNGHLADVAQSNREILTEMRSIITTEGGQPSVRVID